MGGFPFQKLSCVVPCYDEEGNIPRIQSELIHYLKTLGVPAEYIFVDDGSHDQTYLKLSEIADGHPAIHVVRHDKNKGLGQALRTGFQHVSGDAILTLDADLTFHPTEFPKLWAVYKEGVDVVIGSPIKGGFEDVPWIRTFLSRSVNLIYQCLLGQKITSTSAVLRLYRTESLRQLTLTSCSFDINAEIIAKMIFKGFHIAEVPVKLRVRQWGRSKINTLREIKNHVLMFLKVLLWKIQKSS